jgi:predicted GNAT superfamily acetyltransferase
VHGTAASTIRPTQFASDAATVRRVSADPAVAIRPIGAADLGRILEINQANVPEVGSVDADRMAALLQMSPIALAVELDAAIVGFCLVMPSNAPYDSVNYRWFTQRYDDFMYLDRVAFHATAQGRGLGTRLYAAVDRRMVESGANHLALEVNVDPPNEPSLAFHARRGFSEVGQQDTPYGIRVSMQMRPVGHDHPTA